MTETDEAKEFMRTHSKRCPRCGSTEATTIDALVEDPAKMRHRCCTCGGIFTEAETLPSIASERATLTHAKRMMNLYYAVSLRAKRRAAVWREEYKRLQYEKFGSQQEEA